MRPEPRPDHASLKPSMVLTRHDDVLTTELASREVVILDVEQGVYFGVEGVARFVWEALAVPLTVTALVDRVRIAFPDADPHACDIEVRAFLAQLLHHRLVRVVDAADRP